MWQGKIPSAAKAALQMSIYGTAVAAPFQDGDFFRMSRLSVPTSVTNGCWLSILLSGKQRRRL
jgi:hypothetical protein